MPVKTQVIKKNTRILLSEGKDFDILIQVHATSTLLRLLTKVLSVDGLLDYIDQLRTLTAHSNISIDCTY